jgi:cell wall-associated NlpC family hydrolase
MALSALTLAKVATTVGKAATDENGRWIILIAILTPLILVLLVLSSPYAIFFGIFNGDSGNEPVQNILLELEQELIIKIDNEKDRSGFDSVEVIILGSEDNTIIDNSVDVLSFFSVLNTVVNGDEVVYFDKKDKQDLEEMFWEMNLISIEIVERKTTVTSINPKGHKYEKEIIRYHKIIYVDSLLAETMATKYRFNQTELDVLKEVKRSSYLIMPSNSKMYLSSEDIKKIKSRLPVGVEIEREALVKNALSLVGKVDYFWGGKSYCIGFDERWGKDIEVTSSGSASTGTVRPYGLDCSGFISWVFINAGVSLEAIGDGTTNQWNTSTLIPETEAREGDLVFLAIPNTIKINHIGIIVGKDAEGNFLVVHSNSKRNGVTVNTVDEVGFKYFKRSAVLIEY